MKPVYLNDMDIHEFENIVHKAIKHIPEIYQEKLKNVVFRVEDQPTPSQRKKLGLRDCDALFGLYEGVPLTQRSGATYSVLPDVITIFYSPMATMFSDLVSLKKQVYETVWHEVAHFYGLNHSDIHKAKKSK